MAYSFSRHAVALACTAMLLGSLTACRHKIHRAPMLAGAGSTFVYPVMTRWIAQFQLSHGTLDIDYQPVGSGAGLAEWKAGTADFAATEAPLDDAALRRMPPVLQIPDAAGAIGVAYNLPGLTAPLRLSPASLAGIFLGTVQSWNAPTIARDNPGMKLPNLKITVLHRSDSSGTTNVFTHYLAAVSPEWKSRFGEGQTVAWPSGPGAMGSAGIVHSMLQTPGAIGFVEAAYPDQAQLPVAMVQNAAGMFIAPTAAGVSAALDAFAGDLARDPRSPLVNPPAFDRDAYPIAALSFLLVSKDGPANIERAELKGFVQYICGEGQIMAAAQGYVPLPETLQTYDDEQVEQMTAAGKRMK